ncbi:hypothetical protein PanWU01x14_337330 [Parasponia andersonii]|uniref:Uncharacterized protein n=1 Tax=Parasponia andersonii TaxID=3476 RepID=A0A2P5AFL9_PARAD|nr:hypothetical protein PanWU01x14_337330 [Parasponia andersonii]
MAAASGGGGDKLVTDGTQILNSDSVRHYKRNLCSKFSYIRLYAPPHHLNFSRSTCLSQVPLTKL